MKEINAAASVLDFTMLSEALKDKSPNSAIVLEMPNAQIGLYVTLLFDRHTLPELRQMFNWSVNRNDKLHRGQIHVWEVLDGELRLIARISNLCVTTWNH